MHASRHVCSGLLLMATLLSGCGPKNDRLEIGGAITLDGTPLDGGSIQFTSLDAKKMMVSGALVEGGQYTIPQEKGLTPGKYHVEISAVDANAPPIIVRGTPGGPGIPTQPDRIPPEYNVDSKQTVEVSAAGDNRFDFSIVGKPKKK